VRRVLREEMGFRGIVFSDAMDMGAVVRRHGRTEPLLLALEAGVDVLLQPLDAREAVDAVVEGVQSGRIPQSRVDDAVRAVLTAKARAGLHRRRTVSLEAVDERVGIRAHQQLAQTVAERSITLARDGRGMVPLVAGARVVSITYADAYDLPAGRAFDRELTRLGFRVTSFRVDDRTSAEVYAQMRAQADSADVVLASAYVQPREHVGTVGARGGFPQFVETLAADGGRVVAVSFGSPYVIGFYPSAPAYLLAWGGAEVSQRAAARALAGQTPITGRLPVSIPPLFSRGDGLQRPGRP
jgi:beta-N-acetylhexosaminidase